MKTSPGTEYDFSHPERVDPFYFVWDLRERGDLFTPEIARPRGEMRRVRLDPEIEEVELWLELTVFALNNKQVPQPY